MSDQQSAVGDRLKMGLNAMIKMRICERASGEQIAFRPLELVDYERIYAWFAPDAIYQHIHWRPNSLEDARDTVASWLDDEGEIHLVILWKSAPAGLLRLNGVDSNARQLWLSLLLLDVDMVGKGIGTEALAMLIERLASLKMFDHILTWVDVENPRAVACYRRVGFTVIENRAHRFREGKLEMEQYGMEYKLL